MTVNWAAATTEDLLATMQNYPHTTDAAEARREYARRCTASRPTLAGAVRALALAPKIRAIVEDASEERQIPAVAEMLCDKLYAAGVEVEYTLADVGDVITEVT